MAINSSKVDEEQKEVLKSATIRRLFSVSYTHLTLPTTTYV